MPTIAVIEDNVDNRLLLEVMLSNRFDLAEYSNGPDALAGLKAHPPDLVLLDISLPGMDGLEVLGAIRRDAALGSLPVIALTAHAMAGDRERLMAAGFDEYVSKPILDERTLVATIERSLRSRPTAYTAVPPGTGSSAF